MKKLQKLTMIFFAMMLAFSVIGCDEDKGNENSGNGENCDNNGSNDNNGSSDNNGSNDIDWNNEANGTITVINNTSKDMVLFQGQTPSASNILGGVKGLSTKTFDISDDVDDFNIGGYMILRGITKDEYEANKTNLTKAKIEYSAMATYGQGKRFRSEINPNHIGDFAYRVTNIGRIGMELRKDGPDGEKVGYLPSLGSNVMLYADSSEGFSLFPVYVYYNRTNGQVTTLKPASQVESVGVSPKPATGNNIQSYIFPNDEGATWDSIKAGLISPVAYVTITNNVPNQSARVTIAGSNRLKSQNGYDLIGSGETLTYEIKSTPEGSPQHIILQYYNGSLNIQVKKDAAPSPTIKNGFDYTVIITGSGQDSSGYSNTFTESDNARDLSAQIESL